MIKIHYYNYDKILSYNVPVNILIGERGVGKSYGIKDYVIRRNIKKKEKFLYLRRYENEIKSVFQKDYFGDIKDKYKDYELVSKNKKFYINNEVFGYAKRLTEAQDLKSVSFDDISTIIFDEYAIEKNRRYYLPNEGMIIAGFLDSVIRNRNDIRIFFLMNAVEGLEFSPLFSFFDLTLPYNSDIQLFKNNTILLQYMNNEEFRNERKETLIGKLMEGTLYEQYAFQNKIIDKTTEFIERKTGTAKFSFCLYYNNERIGIWNDIKNGKVYVSEDIQTDSPNKFGLTLKDSRPNLMLLSAFQKFEFWKNFINNIKLGIVYYENQKLKHLIYEIIRLYNLLKWYIIKLYFLLYVLIDYLLQLISLHTFFKVC